MNALPPLSELLSQTPAHSVSPEMSEASASPRSSSPLVTLGFATTQERLNSAYRHSAKLMAAAGLGNLSRSLQTAADGKMVPASSGSPAFTILPADLALQRGKIDELHGYLTGEQEQVYERVLSELARGCSEEKLDEKRRELAEIVRSVFALLQSFSRYQIGQLGENEQNPAVIARVRQSFFNEMGEDVKLAFEEFTEEEQMECSEKFIVWSQRFPEESDGRPYNPSLRAWHICREIKRLKTEEATLRADREMLGLRQEPAPTPPAGQNSHSPAECQH